MMTGTRSRGIWPKYFRPFLAWIAACLAAAFVMLVTFTIADGQMGVYGSVVGFLGGTLILGVMVAAVTLIPAPVLVFLARRYNWRRGLADALVPAFLASILFGLFWATQYTALSDWWRGLATGATLGPAGFAGGVTYWLVNGRPGSEEA